jgi:hypothetical protein
MIPDDCSTILVSSVLISTKNAGKSGAVQDPFNNGGPEAAGGTAVDELVCMKSLNRKPTAEDTYGS